MSWLTPIFNARGLPGQRAMCEASDKIDLDKIATLHDLEDCFFMASSIKPRGLIGQIHLKNRDRILSMAESTPRAQLPMFFLPPALIRERTKEVWKRSVLLETMGTKSPPDIDAIQEKVEKPGKHFGCMYVGDYLELLDRVYLLNQLMRCAFLLNSTEMAGAILKDFQSVEDYRQYFPGRPPRNGKQRAKPERAIRHPGYIEPLWA